MYICNMYNNAGRILSVLADPRVRLRAFLPAIQLETSKNKADGLLLQIATYLPYSDNSDAILRNCKHAQELRRDP